MRFETLETRCVLSAAPFIDETGRLNILGTSSDDFVEVSQAGARVLVSITTNDVTAQHEFLRADMNLLYFKGYVGNDTFYNNTAMRSLVYGNGGDDKMYGGRNRDEFHGGDGNDLLVGNDGKDYLHGDGGNDTLRGGLGNDVMYGFRGDDVLEGGEGNDYVSGFTGDDRLFGGAGRDTIRGHEGDDYIEGGDDRDRIYGFKGDDEIHAGGGNDYITSYTGDDIIYGGDGDDIVHAHEGNDRIDGGAGNDRLFGYLGHDTLVGGEGDDYLSGYFGDDIIFGNDGIDSLHGHEGNDELYGGAGDDKLLGWKGDDILIGDGGDDYLSGFHGDDTIDGGTGDDVLHGHIGDDIMSGGDGDDTLWGWRGEDVLRGGAGDDYVSGSYDNDIVYGGEGNDEVRGGRGDDLLYGGDGEDHLVGHQGNDLLDGGADNDMLCGGDDDDTLIGRHGEDVINGMAGFDTVHFDDSFDAIAIDLTKQIALQDGAEEAVRFLEAAVGSLGDDMFTLAEPGEEAVYHLDGSDGFDVLSLLDYTEDDVEMIDGGLIVTTATSSFTVHYTNIEKIELADRENLLVVELPVIEEYIHTIFINDSGRNLASYNTASGVFNIIGQTSVVMTDIAVSADGRMFGTTFSGLYEIDPKTAATTFVATYQGVGTMNALAFLPDGTLVGTGYGTSELYSIDVATAELTSLGAIGVGSAGDLAVHEGVLLMTTTDGRLLAIDFNDVPVTSTVVGSISSLTYGLASQGTDDLYAGAGSTLYALNDETTAVDLVENLSSQGIQTIYGMSAYNEVIPEHVASL